LKLSWKTLQTTVNALSLRERRLLAGTLAVLLLVVFVFVLWMPMAESILGARRSYIESQGIVHQSKQQILMLETKAKEDVNAPLRLEIEALNKRLVEQDVEIHQLTSALITPKNMNQVFSGILTENHLLIKNVKNQPARAIQVKEEENNLLYKHSLFLEMKGGFLDTLKYLQELERQDWQLYWDELTFKTEAYPQGAVTIEVHTLSTSEEVLGL